MFNSKKCPHCNEKIKEIFDFCPSCGKQLKKREDDWGMLGKNDLIEERDNFAQMPFGGIAGGLLGKMLGSTMKMLEKELQRSIQNNNNTENKNFELFINGKRIDPRNIKVTKQRIQKIPQQMNKKQKTIFLPNNLLENFSMLPQKEPETSIRRLADSIVYEIKLPGVKKEENLSIRRIGESIEIKAIAKDKAYIKTITINLPIIGYEFSKESLILELENKIN